VSPPVTAFVLGGGGHRGAYEVGMLKALARRGIEPDVIVGTSIGAINGALFASSPNADGIRALEEAWRHLEFRDLFPGRPWSRVWSAVRQRTYLHDNTHLREWLTDRVGGAAIEDLPVQFQCVSARIEDSSEHWFTSGSLVDALLASSAVPGLLPPVQVAGKHYVDGGVVNSIPLSRALEFGATRIFVLHVGHIDDELEVPTRPWDVGVVAFEIARRHRFASDLANAPDGASVHVLPTGAVAGRFNDPSKLRYGDLSAADRSIASAYGATDAYLDSIDEHERQPATVEPFVSLLTSLVGMDEKDALRLLLEIADFGWFITSEAERIQPSRIAANIPSLVLCSLELHGAQRPTDLAAMTRLTSGRMTQVVDALEGDGFVRRSPDPEDGRGRLIEITEAGSVEVASLGAALATVLRKHPDRVEALLEALGGLTPGSPPEEVA